MKHANNYRLVSPGIWQNVVVFSMRHSRKAERRLKRFSEIQNTLTVTVTVHQTSPGLWLTVTVVFLVSWSRTPLKVVNPALRTREAATQTW